MYPFFEIIETLKLNISDIISRISTYYCSDDAHKGRDGGQKRGEAREGWPAREQAATACWNLGSGYSRALIAYRYASDTSENAASTQWHFANAEGTLVRHPEGYREYTEGYDGAGKYSAFIQSG